MNEIVSFSKEIEFKTMLNKITSISLEHTLRPDEDSTVKGDLIVAGTYKQTMASQIENPFSYKIPVDIVVDEKYDLTNLVIDIDDFTYEVLEDNKLKVNIDLILDNLELKKEEDKSDDDLIDINDLFLESDTAKKLEVPKSDVETLEFDEELNPSKTLEETPIDEELRSDEDFSNLEEKEEQETCDKKDDSFEKRELNNNEQSNNTCDEENKNFFEEVESIKKEQNSNTYEEENTCEEESLEESQSESLFSNLSTKETYTAYRIYIMRENDNLEEVMSKYKVSREKLEEYNNLNEVKVGTKLIIPATNE